jgi:hypothetical protein
MVRCRYGTLSFSGWCDSVTDVGSRARVGSSGAPGSTGRGSGRAPGLWPGAARRGVRAAGGDQALRGDAVDGLRAAAGAPRAEGRDTLEPVGPAADARARRGAVREDGVPEPRARLLPGRGAPVPLGDAAGQHERRRRGSDLRRDGQPVPAAHVDERGSHGGAAARAGHERADGHRQQRRSQLHARLRCRAGGLHPTPWATACGRSIWEAAG